jgi:mono/diheme cytochrome c family protein
MQMIRVGIAAVPLLAATPGGAQETAIERGQYLIHAGGCIDCHTEDRDDATPLAGGRALESPFGTFYTPNITPDVDTGIGAWTDEDFLNAFWNGVDPDGQHYYPSFPYTAYTGVSRHDLLAMKTYLFSLEPVEKVTPEHELKWYVSTRLAVGAWKLKNFDSKRFTPDPARSDEWNRGAYLVRHLGHCGECHTPRNSTGGLRNERELSGNPDWPGDEEMPNLTPHREDGIGKWSTGDIEYFLQTGMFPDGDFVGGSMSAVIDHNTSELSKTDRLAIAAYLKSVRPLQSSE